MKILETPRLLLRHLEPTDLDDLYALYRDPEMRRYFPDGTLTYEETKEELEWYLHGHPDYPQLGLWATLLKADKRFIGRCGLLPWTIDGQDEVEIAYMIAKPYWRQGLGAEAARGIRDYGFQTLKLPRLISMMYPENQASINTAKKIGMTFDKEAEDEAGRFFVYAIANPIPNQLQVADRTVAIVRARDAGLG
ncbi:MAG: GNAT family N-acetyltransferase [Caldilineaceae bacterium]|nr:GNAT family N-acetyltransferase [Caldilineaceae bacterium]